MSGAGFLAGFLLLPLVGAGPMLLRRFDWMPATARLCAAAAVGAVLLCGEMFALTALGVRWSLPSLLAAPLVLAGCVSFGRALGRPSTARAPRAGVTSTSALFLSMAAAAIGLVAFAAMTARVTSSDLLLFWGAKGERFGLARAIDAAFLAHPNHHFMNVDYPPLWPCLYAVGTIIAGRLTWGATLATLPVFLTLSVASVWSFSRSRLGTDEASVFAALYSAMFAFLLGNAFTAGNADAALLFFEGLALLTLTFAPEGRGAFLLAGIALAGATLLKLEGTAFSGAVIVGCLVFVRPLPWRRFAQLALPPAGAFAGWLIYCRSHGLVDTLSSRRPLVLTSDRFALVARGLVSVASFDSVYVPWLVVVFLIVARKTVRVSGVALLTAALVLLFDAGIYFTTTVDPSQWILWAGQRTLLTPLLALFVAGIAADRRPGSGRDGAKGGTRTPTVLPTGS